MRILFLSVILISYNLCFSQTPKQLDEKNGFKIFHLGDHLSKYKGDIQYLTELKEFKVNTYTYKGSNQDVFNVFGFPIDHIALSFDKTDKLVLIVLIKKYSPDNKEHYGDALNDMQSIKGNFTVLFGDFTDVIKSEKDSRIGCVWLSNNVHLELVTSYLGLSKGSNLEINVASKAFFTQNIKDGF